MFIKKVFLTISVAVALSGCEESQSKDSVIMPADNGKQHVSQTALYLPGDSGIDFGKTALSHSVKNDRGVDYNLFVYEFDETYERLDKELSDLLVTDGYSRKVEEDPNYDLRVVYQKPGFPPALFRYRVDVKPGLSKATRLIIWWRKE